MSRKLATLLVAITFLSVGALFGTLLAPRSLEAAKQSGKIQPARVAYVNIATVLRQYKRAGEDGQKISQVRQELADELHGPKEELGKIASQLAISTNEIEKQKLQKKAKELSRKTEDLEAKAQQILKAQTDRTVVEVYLNIREVIRDMAKDRDLDVVECYPDASNDEESRKPSVAQLRLQTPALTPFYVRGDVDLTDEVIERLNKKFPPENKVPGIAD